MNIIAGGFGSIIGRLATVTVAGRLIISNPTPELVVLYKSSQFYLLIPGSTWTNNYPQLLEPWINPRSSPRPQGGIYLTP